MLKMNEDLEKKLINRINELYHKKESVGLTEDEEIERKKLHQKRRKKLKEKKV